ncbi:hypothetical protein P3W45_000510 [Vairimorpha bombi]|jgi:Cdc6-like AAA superfamily ATPase
MSVYKKVQVAFSSSSDFIYLRSDVCKKISSFLSSTRYNILHLTGNPGSGKTSIAKYICKNYEYKYLNSYTDNIKSSILSNKKINLWIIDEYDKIKDKKFISHYIKSTNKKLITLCNTLSSIKRSDSMSISLLPYTSKEIEEIIRLKIKEVGYEICDNSTIKIIAKIFSSTGDMRLVFNYIRDNFNKETNKLEIPKNENIKEEVSEVNVHHRIIKEIVKLNYDRRKAYSEYLDKCDEIAVPGLYRNDFYLVYDVYNI